MIDAGYSYDAAKKDDWLNPKARAYSDHSLRYDHIGAIESKTKPVTHKDVEIGI